MIQSMDVLEEIATAEEGNYYIDIEILYNNINSKCIRTLWTF